jgi:hypothetical protein
MRASGGWCVVVFFGLGAASGCGSNEPFSYRTVTGTVKYDDESLIKADRLEVTFHPQVPPKSPKTYPRPGIGDVDLATGTIKEVTSHKYADGVIAGEHKVTVQTYGSDGEPADLLRVEYTDVSTTPLTYRTSDGPATIRLKKK